jgi:hypothetical protein
VNRQQLTWRDAQAIASISQHSPEGKGSNSPNTSMPKGLSYGREVVHGTLPGTKDPFRRNPSWQHDLGPRCFGWPLSD